MDWEKKDVPQKKTLGQEYIDRFDPDDKGYETRNIIEDYGLKRFQPEIEDVIKKHKDFASSYYIWIVCQDIAHFEAKKFTFVVRESCPTPHWETILLHYNNKSSVLKLEWLLPTKEGAVAMLENPTGWDPLMIASIQKHLPYLQRQEELYYQKYSDTIHLSQKKTQA